MNATAFTWARERPTWREFFASVEPRWLIVRLGLVFVAGAAVGITLALVDVGRDVLFASLVTALLTAGALATAIMAARRMRESRLLRLESHLAHFGSVGITGQLAKGENVSPELEKALAELRHAVNRAIAEYGEDWPGTVSGSIAVGNTPDHRVDVEDRIGVDINVRDAEGHTVYEIRTRREAEMYWAIALYRSALMDLVEVKRHSKQRFENQQLSLSHDD